MMRTRISVVLALAVLLGFASADESSSNACYDALDSCVAPALNKYSHAWQINSLDDFIAIGQETDVDTACDDLEILRTCVQLALITECLSEVAHLETVETVISVIAYSCSENGRAVLREMKLSPCLNDAGSLNNALAVFGQCQEDMFMTALPIIEYAEANGTEPDPTIICPIIEQNANCVVSGSEYICGTAVSQYLRGLWVIMRDLDGPYSQYNCYTGAQRVRSFARRGLPNLFKF